MRLTPTEKTTITRAIRQQDPAAVIILFGSRANDQQKGGDIDLLVVSDHIDFRQEWKIRRDILDRIGWQKLDLIIRRSDQTDSAIVDIANETGIPL